MSTITEANNLGDLLKYEAPNRYSRDVATIAAGQNLPLGTVLGRKTDDGKQDRKSTRLNSSHPYVSRMPSSA